MFHKFVIAPFTEYACPTWNKSLTKNNTETLKNMKKKAMSVIFSGRNYHKALKISKLSTLCNRRDLLCKAFFMQVAKPEHNLTYLLEKRKEHLYKLRHNQMYKIEIPHIDRYQKKNCIAFTSTL